MRLTALQNSRIVLSLSLASNSSTSLSWSMSRDSCLTEVMEPTESGRLLELVEEEYGGRGRDEEDPDAAEGGR